ncbi:MAG: TolB family protein [Planctomycetota bacterium]|jgi:Tol biopolymer transport system component
MRGFLCIFPVLLAALGGCDDPSERAASPVAQNQFVEPVGDIRDVRFSPQKFAITFTVRDVVGQDLVYAHDLTTNTSAPVSVVPDATNILLFAPDGDSFGASMDNTGKTVAYLSNSTDLAARVQATTLGVVEADLSTSGILQLYGRRLDQSFQSFLLSQDANGREADAPVTSAMVSGNGRWIVFASAAKNLEPVNSNGFSQIHAFDTARIGNPVLEHTITSLNSFQEPANDDCFDPYISRDNRWLVFDSFATNLDAGDANGTVDIYMRDRVDLVTTRVTDSRGGVNATVSDDGVWVTYQAQAGGASQVFLKNMASGTLSPLTSGNLDSRNAQVNPTGAFVVFESDASDLVPGDTNGVTDIFVYQIATATTVRLTVGPAGEEAEQSSSRPSISYDGRLIAFQSTAFNITGSNPSGVSDVFVFSNPFLRE